MSENKTVTLTDNLVRKVKELQEREGNASLMLRVGVNGGGCQGFEYQFDFADGINDDDIVFEKDNIKVLIDSASLPLMDGAEIDFVSEMIGSSFQVRNPNAKSSCGCGTSFSI
jgi:iron-sulfur cluster insertion protein